MAMESPSSEDAATISSTNRSTDSLDAGSCETQWNMRMEAIPQIVWIADAEGAVTYFNQRWARLTGIPVPLALGWGFVEAIHPDDRDRTVRLWRECVEALHNFRTEFRLQQADGSYRKFLVRARPVNVGTDELLEWVGTYVDVHRIERTQTERDKDRTFLDALLANLSDGIVACDETGTLTLFNTASQQMHGLPQEAIASDAWADHYNLYLPDGKTPLPVSQIPLYRALSGESVRDVEMAIVSPSGQLRQILASGDPILDPDGKKIGAVVAMRDITAYKQAEAACQQSERLFRAIFDQSYQFIGLMQPDGTLLEVNQTALDFAGLLPKDVIGKPFWQTHWWSHSAEAQQELKRAIAQAAAGALVAYETEVRGVGARRAIIDFSIKPIKNDQGQVVLLIPEGRNITKRKQAEARVHQLNAELEQRVKERTAQLEDSTRLLEELLVRERELRTQSEADRAEIQLFANIVQNMQLGLNVWHLDDPADPLSLRLVSTNPAASEMLGFPLANYVGAYITECGYPGPAEQHETERSLCAQIALKNQGATKTLNYYINRETGQEVWFSLNLFPLPGRCVGVAFENITERRQAERALSESESRYANLTALVPVGIFRCDVGGNCLFVNERWLEITGLTITEALGQGWKQALHPDDHSKMQAAVKQAIETGMPYQCELRFLRPDGSIAWVISQAIAETDEHDQIQSFVGTLTDITERKRYEDTVRESEERFRATFEQAAVGICHVAPDGRWLRVNQRLCDIVGYTRDELRQMTFQQITHPEDLEPDLAYANQLLVGDIESYSIEKRYIKKSGEAVWIELTGSLVRDTVTHSPKYFIGVIEDIMERKQAELKLQERARELGNLNTLLANTTNLLHKRNQELDQFAYVTSHDLKAPLRAIANLSEWIEEDLEGKLPEENKRQFQLLRGRVNRMEGLINGLLEYSRVGRGQTPIEQVDVEDLLVDVIDSISPPPTFTVEVATPMPTFMTKRIPLQQVLTNLISNGIKHHDREDGVVKISVEDSGKYYKFLVSDDGKGIAPQYHDRVFVIFQTLESRDTKENTGIGLSIVKKIVETEGGSIAIESDVGQGATFWFTWPKRGAT